MVTSPNEWKILEWDEKLQASKQTNQKWCLRYNTKIRFAYFYNKTIYAARSFFFLRNLTSQ